MDAEPAAGQFGLVILSCGSGGFDLGHRDTAIALAKAGFIAAAPLHPRNNFRDDIGNDQRIVLDSRPRRLSAVIDAHLAQQAWSSRIDSKEIAAFGFSAGGYTVLAALGAAPEFSRILDHCERHAEDNPYCRIINDVGAEESAPHALIAPVPESVGTNLAGAERFDRAAFHHQMNRRAALDEEVSRIIVTFFKRAFSDGAEN